jgi:hypothetical protein
MDIKQILLSDASTDAKLSALAILLDKQLPILEGHVKEVEKLQGPQGDKGDKGDQGPQGERGIDGVKGDSGLNGKDGSNGIDGEDGVSIVGTKIDFDGSLVVTFSDGKVINVGDVVGEKGERGPQGAAGVSGANGEAFANLDGGVPNSVYGGTTPIDAGGI